MIKYKSLNLLKKKKKKNPHTYFIMYFFGNSKSTYKYLERKKELFIFFTHYLKLDS